MPQTKHSFPEPTPLLADTLPRLPARSPDAHKGQFGHVLLIGGDRGFGGSITLSAQSALRCGAGLVSLATRPEHVSMALTRLPA
ncbi:NAD(P)H-hydrate dehydratase, partial [Pseudomonas endophytica]|uniref:NAD(P)H-hydrate dehydratase n=1 Tax=Pseudomonas endophytica TaxID=1563157 RepID=UPI000A89E4A8